MMEYAAAGAEGETFGNTIAFPRERGPNLEIVQSQSGGGNRERNLGLTNVESLTKYLVA